MSTPSMIMMAVTLMGYGLGSYVLLNKVFKSQQHKK